MGLRACTKRVAATAMPQANRHEAVPIQHARAFVGLATAGWPRRQGRRAMAVPCDRMTTS